MTYSINLKNKKLMQHGEKIFDERCYGMFFEKYNYKEMLSYYRFFRGWIRFLDGRLPLKSGKGKKVLEIGCGIGAFAKILNERGFKVDATDVSPFIVERAKKIHSGINFKTLNIEKVTRINEKYDYIFAFEVLEHLKNPIVALENIKKMLKDKGVLVFSTPFPTKEMLADPMHINVHDPKFWLAKGKKVGYKSVKMKCVSFVPFLYKLHSIFSIALPFRIDNYFINSTGIYLFLK